jgi:glutamate carboxypeptidase
VNILKDLLNAKKQEMFQLLEQLVNIDSGSNTKMGLDTIGTLLKARFEQIDFIVEVIHEKAYGNHLVMQHRDAKNPEIIIVGHMDTVFPEGTAKKRPFTIEGERAFGPGVIDMKASLVSLLYALTALKRAGKKGYKNVQIILNSDEEIGSPSSRQLIMKHAMNKKFALILEAARPDGSIVTARRGSGQFQIIVEGKSAHAGIEPEKGKSAVEELAHKIIHLQQLTDHQKGIHVNVGIISGGTSVNTIPAMATATIDVRVSQMKQIEPIQKEIEKICAMTHVEGTKTKLIGEIDRMPVEKTDGVKSLLKIIQQVGQGMGLTITDTATGGSSDGSLTASAGVATVDGLGPIGGLFHSEEEYLEISSLLERTLLLAEVIQRLSVLEKHDLTP